MTEKTINNTLNTLPEDFKFSIDSFSKIFDLFFNTLAKNIQAKNIIAQTTIKFLQSLHIMNESFFGFLLQIFNAIQYNQLSNLFTSFLNKFVIGWNKRLSIGNLLFSLVNFSYLLQRILKLVTLWKPLTGDALQTHEDLSLLSTASGLIGSLWWIGSDLKNNRPMVIHQQPSTYVALLTAKDLLLFETEKWLKRHAHLPENESYYFLRQEGYKLFIVANLLMLNMFQDREKKLNAFSFRSMLLAITMITTSLQAIYNYHSGKYQRKASDASNQNAQQESWVATQSLTQTGFSFFSNGFNTVREVIQNYSINNDDGTCSEDYKTAYRS